MNTELENKLFEKYPKILDKQKLLDGCLRCGDGWYMLIDTLCHDLQFNTDHNNRKEQGNEGRYPQVQALQVKEKLGGLRFYINSANDVQMGEISFAESMSYKICEKCGSTDDVDLTDTSWKQSLCKTCRGDAPLLRDRKTIIKNKE